MRKFTLAEYFEDPEQFVAEKQEPAEVIMTQEDLEIIADLVKNEAVRNRCKRSQKQNDNVTHPAHYADHCSVECIDIIRIVLGDDGFRAFCLGNALKYLWRHKYKGVFEDLDKAEVYLDWLSGLGDTRVPAIEWMLVNARRKLDHANG